jgi:hypothetical protein
LCINKEVLIDLNTRKSICSSLTQDQLSQLLHNFTPDEYNPQPIHPAILEAICGNKKPPFDFQLDAHHKCKFSLSVKYYTSLLDKKVELPNSIKNRETLYFLSPDFQNEYEEDSDEW